MHPLANAEQSTHRPFVRRRKINSLDELSAVVQTQRHRIVTILRGQPLKVSEIARRLQLPRTGVYYHLRVLETHGFVRALRDAPERSIRYVATADNFAVDRAALSHQCGERNVNKAQSEILKSAASDLAEAPGSVRGQPVYDSESVMVGRTFFRVRTEDWPALRRRLNEVFYEFDALQRSGEQLMELVIACFPIDERT